MMDEWTNRLKKKKIGLIYGRMEELKDQWMK